MQVLLSKHWHHLPIQEVVELLETHLEKGLDIFEVHHRQERFGPNLITPPRGPSWLLRFLYQFNNPLVYILLVAGVLTAVLKDPVDAVIIFSVVLVNALIGFFQEAKAEKAIESLAQAMSTEATVVRAGKTQRLPAGELVPGDVVMLKAGDKVPADLRLVRTRDLQIAEAALTGESVPVRKDALVSLNPATLVADRCNMAYAGTLVTSGQGVGLVTATGDSTEVGRISQLISTAQELTTPLTRKMARFSHLILYVILALAGVAFLVGIGRGQPAIDTFTAAIALAVGMIPEGLPAALTVTLAIGVSRMAGRRAIIRHLPAVETLGSVTVICSDKTGTLTQNQMTVQWIVVAGTRYEVTGSGYAPIGQIRQEGTSVDPASIPPLWECLRAGLLCNDSALTEHQGTWIAEGDPTEVALIVSARKGGVSPETEREQWPRLDEIPFDPQRQYMATLHDAGPGQPRIVYLKGAVEVVLQRCTSALGPAGERVSLEADQVQQEVAAMAAQGLRVLAFAQGQLPPEEASLNPAEGPSNLTFLGFQAMIDPPRPEARAAVQTCRKAGVRVKMITGDHPLTAGAIAQQLHLDGVASSPGEALPVRTGQDLAALSDQELMEEAERISVFARVSPEQKLRLVEALQSQGHIVAMTGDGVNDGPALKQADVGIAMGISGTEVAKEAADMILTDDNFATIEAAVEEGRGVFDNLTKIIAWTLPTNLGEGLIILLALLLGTVLPILPIQILWINMTTVAVLGIVLALEQKEPDIMDRPPRDPQAPILTRELSGRIVIVGTLILLGAFGLFEGALKSGASLAQARTAAVNAVVMVEVFYLLNCRSLTQSMFRIGVLSNPWLIVGIMAMLLLQIFFTYPPFMNQVLGSAPIAIETWGWLLTLGILSYLVVEGEKGWRQRGRGKGQKPLSS